MDMIVKSESLISVADAIREKGKTSEQLVFPDGFAMAIMEIQSGGVHPQLIVTAPAGSTITAVNGEETVTGMVGEEGTLTLDLPAFGTWMVTATLDERSANTTISIAQEYPVKLNYAVLTTIHGAPNEVVTVKVGTDEIVKVDLNADGDWTGDITGIANKTVTFAGAISDFTKDVDVGNVEELTVNVYPDGALYWYGRQFTNITGGWAKYSEGTASVSIGDTIVIDGSGSKWSHVSTNSKATFDKTYKTLYFDISVDGSSSNSNYALSVASSRATDDMVAGGQTTKPPNGTKTVPFDISNVSGDYYVQVACFNLTLTVKSVYMMKEVT